MGIYKETQQGLPRTGTLQDESVYICEQIGLKRYVILKRPQAIILLQTVFKRNVTKRRKKRCMLCRR